MDACEEEIKRASSAIDDCLSNDVLQHKGPRGGGGIKRRRGYDDNDTEKDLQEKMYKFQHSPLYLRIPASSVSALCGLHPYQNLPQLLFDFVYQSYLGQLLLQRDAKALGLTLVDAKQHEQQTMLSLASAVSNETKELVKQVLEVSEGKRKLQSVDEVQSIQTKIKASANKAQESGIISKGQVASLVEASRGHVSTGFGTAHEDEALDIYEKRTGCRVRERNEALMEWKFKRVEDVDGSVEMGVTPVPMGEAKRKCWDGGIGVRVSNDDGKDAKEDDDLALAIAMSLSESDKEGVMAVKEEAPCRDGTETKPIGIDDSAENIAHIESNDEVIDVVENLVESVINKEKPFFRIVGAVDGVRDDLYLDSSKPSAASSIKPSDDDQHVNNTHNGIYNFTDEEEEGQWTLRPIIVECKHRMKEAKIPPPLYDQIQTCLYCHMYNVEEADLIQVVRRRGKSEEKENDAIKTDGINKNGENDSKDNKKGMAKDKENVEVTVTRISLHDPIHNHNHHWKATLLPRLASFVGAVYNVRKDDGKRYRMLMALVQTQQGESNAVAEEESWKVLWEECPWLMHCDTAFRRRRN